MASNDRSEGAARFAVRAATCALALSCSSSTPPQSSNANLDSGAQASTNDAGQPPPGAATAHGTLLDYSSLKGVAGFTITDGTHSATTDAQGLWSFETTIGAPLVLSVTGPKYSRVIFGTVIPETADVDFGNQVIPDTTLFNLGDTILGNDTSMALVEVVLIPRGACTSAEGATITVASPAGAPLAYYTSAGIPDTSLTAVQTIKDRRPSAVIYDVPLGSTFDIRVTHPTCTQKPFPVEDDGKAVTGQAVTAATSPDGVSSGIAVILD